MEALRKMKFVLACLVLSHSFVVAQDVSSDKFSEGLETVLLPRSSRFRVIYNNYWNPAPDDDVKLVTITFNEHPLTVAGKRCDAFVLGHHTYYRYNPDTPVSHPEGFAWIFNPPSNLEGWGIISPDKKVAFKSYSTLESGKIVQGLPYGTINTRGEYLIWFCFSDDKPTKITFGYRRDRDPEFKADADGRLSGIQVLRQLFPSHKD